MTMSANVSFYPQQPSGASALLERRLKGIQTKVDAAVKYNKILDTLSKNQVSPFKIIKTNQSQKWIQSIQPSDTVDTGLSPAPEASGAKSLRFDLRTDASKSLPKIKKNDRLLADVSEELAGKYSIQRKPLAAKALPADNPFRNREAKSILERNALAKVPDAPSPMLPTTVSLPQAKQVAEDMRSLRKLLHQRTGSDLQPTTAPLKTSAEVGFAAMSLSTTRPPSRKLNFIDNLSASKQSLPKLKFTSRNNSSDSTMLEQTPGKASLSKDRLVSELISKAVPQTYFMQNLKRVIQDKALSGPLDLTIYNQFLKNMKDLSSMASDELIDEEEYLEKIKLRKTLKEKDCSFLEDGPSVLPLLILDLDETLVHCVKDPTKDASFRAEYTGNNQQKVLLRYNVRPHAQKFLEEMSQYFTLFVFTASEAGYARTLVAAVDPERAFIKRVFDRRFCCVTQKGYVVKDLRLFSREAKLKNILIADNSCYCFFPQAKNGVPVLPFEHNKQDRELLELKEYLKHLSKKHDMLAANAEHFRLHRYADAASIDDLCSKLF